MKLLSKASFASAKEYLEKHGRKLDLAWYRLVFEGGTREEGADALRAYQWDTGGFGRALAPDHRTALPSCHETCVAFGWFERFGLSMADTMVQNALAFLENGYDAREGRWPAFPREANAAPHAVWWHFKEGETLCDAEKAWGLPSAEILGIMLTYDAGNELWDRVFEKAVRHLDDVRPNMDISEAVNYTRMLGSLAGEKRELILKKMSGVLEHIIETDERTWTEYSSMPLMYIQSPASPFYDSFREAVDKNLDWEIDRQTAEGCWTPNWQWWRDEQHWPQARDEWKSYLTAERLVILNRFGKIER